MARYINPSDGTGLQGVSIRIVPDCFMEETLEAKIEIRQGEDTFTSTSPFT